MPKQPARPASSVVWVRKLSAKCTDAMLRDGFNQWQARVLSMGGDPISAGHDGQALLQLSNHETVCPCVAFPPPLHGRRVCWTLPIVENA